jgi:hypothetical protein
MPSDFKAGGFWRGGQTHLEMKSWLTAGRENAAWTLDFLAQQLRESEQQGRPRNNERQGSSHVWVTAVHTMREPDICERCECNSTRPYPPKNCMTQIPVCGLPYRRTSPLNGNSARSKASPSHLFNHPDCL